MQPLRASQAQQHQSLLQQSSGPSLAKKDSAEQKAPGPSHVQACVLGAALPASKALSHSQQPVSGSSCAATSAAQNTGVFAGKSTGVFANDDEEEEEDEDANWDAEVAKLLENAALSRPDQEAHQTSPWVTIHNQELLQTGPF